jgi:hypothetical protein
MGVFGLLAQDAHQRIGDVLDQLRLLLAAGASGDLHIDVGHREWLLKKKRRVGA